MYWCIFFSILQIYKDSQFNNTKIKNSKIQVQNKTQALRKSYAFLNKACTCRGHININNNNNDNNNDNDDNNNNNNIIIIIIIKYIYIYKRAERERKDRERETNYRHIFEALTNSMKNSRLLNPKKLFSKLE